jgi:hypothetical protein
MASIATTTEALRMFGHRKHNLYFRPYVYLMPFDLPLCEELHIPINVAADRISINILETHSIMPTLHPGIKQA